MLLNTKSDMIFLSPPHLGEKEKDYIQEALDSNWIAPTGPHLDAFEKEVADYIGVDGAVALSSGTAAIHVALSLLNIEKGDKVFCSTLTFVASANPILYLGGEPVFIDSEPTSWNMSSVALAKALKEAAIKDELPKAVIVVHLYGQTAKMDEIMEICNDYEVPVIEDAAESLGSTYKGKASGSIGEYGIFSFNGNKIITSSGGGMIVSNSKEALEKARFLATQAKDPAPFYQHSKMGFNYRLSNILAAIGRAQFSLLDERVHLRRKVFTVYQKELNQINGVSFMPEYLGSRSSRWLTVLLVDEKVTGNSASEIVTYLNQQNIEARAVWKPLHLQPLFKGCSYYSHYPGKHVAEELFQSGICLPSGSSLTEIDQMFVINHLKKVLESSYDREAVI
ncbi:pyridoxal phosphate-dependent aminotransferase [Salipaludibacillus neizhouensis]|uniref:Pyridoxal phosphate-dependent aminotransferase n=1 Tax=Salipaludibacillus neizhouensis TaxID=885475 RepID=A0A3A9K9V7_9BACI|nr:aminotransferase class I/II-fold pyridoxal phosphate-dependent enzyme [Salipaludibacillus neizhouensis]RKL66423.1 pyridoxal phosphate-dependent aminotransferase [Salipaludibacillus neizhouensis]